MAKAPPRDSGEGERLLEALLLFRQLGAGPRCSGGHGRCSDGIRLRSWSRQPVQSQRHLVQVEWAARLGRRSSYSML